MGAIQQSRISKLVYGTNAVNDIFIKPFTVDENVLEVECSSLLKTFFQNRRN
jgi:tRNA(Arg) A34 adenosine deaminase TadA